MPTVETPTHKIPYMTGTTPLKDLASTSKAQAERFDALLSSGVLRGPAGAAGPKGSMGAEGPRGFKGDKGDTGLNGQAGPQGIPGVQGIAGPKGDTGPQGAKGDAGPQGIAGPKGDTGATGPQGIHGYTITSLADATTDPDTLKTSGMWRYLSTAGAHAAKLPQSQVGVLQVLDRSNGQANRVFQEYHVQAAGGPQRVFYRRFFDGGSWTAWAAFTETRVSEAAGRAIYAWDATNHREQMIYGDTGWRDVSSLLVNGWKGIVHMRRTLHDVKLQIVSLSAAEATSGTFMVAPTGFQLGLTSLGNVRGFVFSNTNPITMRSVNISGSATVSVTQYTTADVQLLGSFEWSTHQPWPTVLPGTATGIIPT